MSGWSPRLQPSSRLPAARSRRTGRPERRFKTFMWTDAPKLEPQPSGRRKGRVDQG